MKSKKINIAAGGRHNKRKFVYDDETLDALEKRREDFIKSGAKGLTVEESMQFVRNELKKRGLNVTVPPQS